LINSPAGHPLPLSQDTQVIESPADQKKLTARCTEQAAKFITANRDRPFLLFDADTLAPAAGAVAG
jgi:hypothetical protein